MRLLTSLIALACVTVPALVTAPAFAADVGVAISVGDPRFYGQIVIGNAPPPLLIYREPILVIHSIQVGPPIYMRVPPGHAKNWKKHCGSYGACGRRVYFVQDGWYNDVYVPHYRKQHGHKGGSKGKGKGKPD